MREWVDWLVTGVSVIIGGFITWLVAWRYYERAGQQLKHESAELRRLTALALKAFEEAGVEFTKDSKGNFKGIVRRGACDIQASTKMIAEGQDASRIPGSQTKPERAG
jgi:hypothetical protein